MAYDGMYGDLSTRGTSNEILTQVLEVKNTVLLSEANVVSLEATTVSNTALAAGSANIASNSAGTAANSASISLNAQVAAEAAQLAAEVAAQAAQDGSGLTALTLANTAISTADGAVSTANTASSDASAAVITANAAGVTAGNAVTTANAANVTAGNALTTANSKQPSDPTLTALAAVTLAADKLIYGTGSEVAALTTLTSYIRTLLDDTSALAARATLGVRNIGAYHLDGLKMTYVGRRAVTISAGACMTPSGVWIETQVDIPLTAMVLVSGFNHLYAYDAGSGTLAVQVSSTAPVRVSGSAFGKTGATTHRYIGSVLASGALDMWAFIHTPVTNDITYIEGTPGTAPFPVFTGFGGTSVVPVATATVVPKETTIFLRGTCLISGGNIVFGNSDQLTGLSGGTWLTSVLSSAAATNPVDIYLSRSATYPGEFQTMCVASGVSSSLYAQGYRFER